MISARIVADSASAYTGARLTPDHSEDWQNQPCILGRSRQSRKAWKRAYGDPGSLNVLHRCNNDTCRELTHLYLGTQRENTRDAIAAGHFTPPMTRPDIRAKVSASLKGKPLTPEHRAAVVKALHGRKKSPETRAKISAVKRQRNAERGPLPTPDRYPTGKLNRDDVIEMRRLHDEGVGNGELASRFGVSTQMVWGIVTRRKWKNI